MNTTIDLKTAKTIEAMNQKINHMDNADADHLLAASHKRDAVLGQIALDQIQVTGGKGNKAAIGVVADKDNGTGQIPLASQCDDLTRVVTESQRHIFADAVAGICFIEARQVTANVRQRGDGQFDLRGNHGGVNFIIAELPLQHIAHLVEEVGHSIVHVADLLAHTVDGLCGLEINGSVHSAFSPNFCKKERPGWVLHSKCVLAFILPLLFALPLIQQLDDSVLHLFGGVVAGKVFPQGIVFDDYLVQLVLFLFSHDRKGNVIREVPFLRQLFEPLRLRKGRRILGVIHRF